MTNFTLQCIAKFILIAVKAISNGVARHDLAQGNKLVRVKTKGYKLNVSVEQS